MLALSCISHRSAASVKSVGACRLAATVCPTSTAREITMPSIGDVITVFSGSLRPASARRAPASTCAAADLTCASAVRRATCGRVEIARRDQLPRRPARCARFSLVVGVRQHHVERARRRPRRASEVGARVRSTSAWISDGSSRASTWPFRTIELKSAPSAWTEPETWVPTQNRRRPPRASRSRCHGRERWPAGDRVGRDRGCVGAAPSVVVAATMAGAGDHDDGDGDICVSCIAQCVDSEVALWR